MDSVLTIKYSTSRAKDTFGYTLVTLVDSNTGKKYRATGGGYDMEGAVLGEWLQCSLQTELKKLISSLESKPYGHGLISTFFSFSDYYGLIYNKEKDKVIIQGESGFSCVIDIIKALGFEVEVTQGNNSKVILIK